MTESRFGWHFTGDKLRDGRAIPPVGEWLTHPGIVTPCVSGLHMSEHPRDALTYAPGSILHYVQLRGDLKSHGDPIDKWVGRERKIIASKNMDDLLRKFACDEARALLYFWNAPDVVKEYLETRDESKRHAAWYAARDAASAATRAAARGVSWDAAWYAAIAAARAAARDTVSAASWDATSVVARANMRDRFLLIVLQQPEFSIAEANNATGTESKGA